MAGERAGLQVEIEASGMVTGARTSVRSLDEIKRASASGADTLKRYDAVLNGVGRSLQEHTKVGAQSIRTIGEQIRQAHGLADAYRQGESAVQRYNVELKVEEALARANVVATSAQGRALAEMIRLREGAIVAAEQERLAMEARLTAARNESAAVANQASTFSKLQAAYFGAAIAGAVVLGAVKDVAAAAIEAEVNERKLAAAVRLRGEVYGITTPRLIAFSSALEATTKFDDDSIQQALTVLLRFKEIDGSNIEEITRATLDYAEATGQDAASAAVAFGKALLVPGEGMRALKEIGVTLTDAQQKQIDKWNETGQSAKSVRVILDLVKGSIGGLAAEATNTADGGLAQLANAFDNLKASMGGFATSSGFVSFLKDMADRLRLFNEATTLGPKNGKGAFQAAIDARELGAALEYLRKVQADYRRDQFVGPPAPPIIPPKTKEELEEAARAAKEFADSVQEILDRLNPAAAAERNLQEQIDTVSKALAAGGPKADLYREALAQLRAELANLKSVAEQTIPLLEIPQRTIASAYPDAPKPLTGGSMIVGQPGYTDFERELDKAQADFTSNLATGMGDAAASFAREFVETGKINVERLGDMLLDVLLSAAQQYFATMVANQAKLKMSGGDSASGGGSGAALGIGIFMMAAAAYVAHNQDKKDHSYPGKELGRYYTGGISGGNSQSDYTFYDKELQAGNTHDQNAVVQTVRAYLDAFRHATGDVITELGEFTIQVRHDGEAFKAEYKGVLLGEFATIEDATLAGIRAAFEAGDFTGEMSSIFGQMLTNFKGDAKEMLAGFEFVSNLQDQISGLSDIGLAIRDLPQKTAALTDQLIKYGVSADDAAVLAAKWNAVQMQNLRDQITGHQQTEAEMLAQRQREAEMFNAQLALDKAKTDAEILNLQNQITIENAKVDVMNAANQAQLAILNASLAAYQQIAAVYANIAPIGQGEIHVPRNRGGGHAGGNVDTGPSPAEQRALDFDAFLKGQALDGLSDYLRAFRQMTDEFTAQAEAASEVAGGEEALAAARRAAAAELRENLIDSLGLPMEQVRDRVAGIASKMHDFYLSNVELQRQFDAGEISQEEFAEAVRRSREVMGEFGAVLRGELMNLALYFTDAMGDTKESARIRAELAQLEWTFKKAEFRMMLEAVRAVPGALSDADYQHWLDFLNSLPDKVPVPPAGPPPTTDSGGGGTDPYEEARKRREQALVSALDRLRGALDAYRSFQERTSIGELSGRTLQQRSTDAIALYEQQLALAQAGNLDAITQGLPDAANQALELLGQYLDPSSAQYQAILAQMRLEMSGIQGGIEGILNGSHNPNEEVVTELQSIAEILNSIRDLWGQNVAWNPGAGAGTILPGPGSGTWPGTQTDPNAAGPHPGLVNYGDFWGWHPLGWSPPGGWNHGAGSTHSSASSAVQVQDSGAHAALSRVEAKLLRIEAAQVNDTSKAESARRRQDPRSSKRVGGAYRDEIAS